MKRRVCPNCGTHNTEDAWHCKNCDETLSIFTITEVDEKTLPSATAQQTSNKNQSDEVKMQKWDYKSMFINGKGDELYVDGNLHDKSKNISVGYYLKRFGQEGWELVGVVSECFSGGGYLETRYTGIHFYLKRPIA